MEKKKVGILTFHRADNYGAVLQCYALQEIIKSLGHNVEIINYKQPYIEKLYNPTSTKEIYRVLKKPRWYYGFFFKILPARYKRYIKYKLFRRQYITTGKAFKDSKHIPRYDTIVIGSDQVWGLHCTNGIDEIFFGEFQHNESKVIGYGISGNIQSLKEIGDERLKRYCKNFSMISFREESFQSYIEENIGIKGNLVLDPTLLLDKNKWDKLASGKTKKKDYILTYILQEGKNFSILDESLHHFAKRENCELINIFDVADSPAEFLSWIRDAKYIITTSFHATVFSIIFERQFYALKTNNGHDARYINLLNKLNLYNNAIELEELQNIKPTAINYTKVKDIFIDLRKRSLEYLKEI